MKTRTKTNLLSTGLIAGTILILCCIYTIGCTAEKTYEGVYNEYCQKLADATPGLVDQFKKEAENVSDVTKLAQISTNKVSELAKINTEGCTQFASIHNSKQDDYSTYQDWCNKLNNKYMECSKQITDEYTKVSIDATKSKLGI